jgi:hypothetical protein
MNIIHLKFSTMFGLMFAVAWFDENLKVYQMHWHSMHDENCIGAKLDYSLDELHDVKLKIEEILLAYGASYTLPE